MSYGKNKKGKPMKTPITYALLYESSYWNFVQFCLHIKQPFWKDLFVFPELK